MDFNIDAYTIDELLFIYNINETYTINDILNINLKSIIQLDNYQEPELINNVLLFFEKSKLKIIQNLTNTKKIIDHPIENIIENIIDNGIENKTPINCFNTNVAVGSLNKLRVRSKNIYMSFNTIFRNINNTETITNCSFNLLYTLKNVTSIKLESINIPDLYLLNDNNNCFFIKESNTNLSNFIKIPIGNYNSQELSSIIQNKINLILNTTNFNVKIDPINNRTYISNNINKFNIYFITSETKNKVIYKNLGWILGFRNIEYINCNEITSEGMFNNNTNNYLYFTLKDNYINNSSEFISVDNNSYNNGNILAKIDYNTNCTENNITSIKREYFGPIDIKKIEVKLLDKYNDLIDLNMMDYSFIINFELIYDI
jgi:hypothetical protein